MNKIKVNTKYIASRTFTIIKYLHCIIHNLYKMANYNDNNDIHPDITDVILSKHDIKTCLNDLAQLLINDYNGKSLILICILKGAFVFVSDLMRRLQKIDIAIEFISVSSYGNEISSSVLLLTLKASNFAQHLYFLNI